MAFDAHAYASAWAVAWNARDLDAVLSDFSDDVVFSTPKALDTVGTPTVTGKAGLRAYWQKALGRIEHLHFTVVGTMWDPARRTLVIVYDREINGAHDRALELLTFSPTNRVIAGEVFYGVVPAS
jgi:SnoaL-like domain